MEFNCEKKESNQELLIKFFEGLESAVYSNKVEEYLENTSIKIRNKAVKILEETLLDEYDATIEYLIDIINSSIYMQLKNYS